MDDSVKASAKNKFVENKQELQQQKEQLNNTELDKEQKFKEVKAQEKEERDHNYSTARDHFGRRDDLRGHVTKQLDKKDI